MSAVPATMPAAVYRRPGELEVADVPVPAVGPHDALVEVSYCGLCGTDLHMVLDGWGAPGTVFGHEWSGRVAAAGTEARIEVGAAVVGRGWVECGQCRHCRAGQPGLCAQRPLAGMDDGHSGAFARFLATDHRSLTAVPVGVGLREAAYAEPLAVAMHAVTRGSCVPGGRAMVFGCGPIGAAVVAVLVARGGDVTVVEPSEPRQDLAMRLGAAVRSADDLEDPGHPGQVPAGAVGWVFETSGARQATAASQVDLLTVALRPPRAIPAEHNYIAVLNTDGVPIAHRRIDNPHVRQFKYHPDGKYPFSYFSTLGEIDPGYEIEANDFVVLDANLDEVDRIGTVPGVSNHVDAHDALIKPNGNYVLISYHLGQRDLSDITTDEGVTLSAEHWVRDTIVTEFNPQHNVVMTWSSRDHVNIRDCLPSLNDETPFEVFQYAHGNSLQALPDGDIVVSLRKCSQVFRIDYPSGDTVWKVGRSHSTSPQWRSNLITVRDDPYGEFCGQHAAQVLDNGNLLLFDNDSYCHEDLATGEPDRPNGRVTRIAEYALDVSANEARFLRHHSDQAGLDTWNRFRGWVHQLDGGNWLISWGGRRDAPDPGTVPGPVASITEADPETGEEPLRIRVTWNGGVSTGWASPVARTVLGPSATGSS